MGFKDKDNQPLIQWKTPEDAFNAWCKCSENTPLCDYSGMSYSKLKGGSGIQWPCNKQNPNGTERLYTDYKFMTTIDQCEVYGHDLNTGMYYTIIYYIIYYNTNIIY
jgi:predicted molibdopterin-dependent oxidoreductase YjgC